MGSKHCSTSQWIQLRQLTRLGKNSWWISLLLWLMALAELSVGAAPALADLELRVAIEQGVDQVTIGSSTDAVLQDGSGQVLAEIPAMGALVAQADAGGVNVNEWRAAQVWVEPTAGGYVYIGNKWYRGRTLVVPTSGGLTAVNYVDLEQYLYSVVGGEMPTDWHQEALKAQAVAARSYALYQRQSSANTIFDVGDTTAWQVYDGIEEEAQSTLAAVDATTGQVLTYNEQIIEAVFHSSSGGHTENVEDVWVSPLPYLRAVPDFDQSAPVYQWVNNFSADNLRRRISGVGNVISFTPERTTPHGRVVTMRVDGDAGSRVMSGNELRQALELKSTLFSVIPQFDPVASVENVPPTPTGFQVSGRGFGHGLGMSQWGAQGLAQQGFTYQQIVTHYYTGATLSRIQVQ